MSERIGSSLNDFLEEEGLLEESEKVAIQRIEEAVTANKNDNAG